MQDLVPPRSSAKTTHRPRLETTHSVSALFFHVRVLDVAKEVVDAGVVRGIFVGPACKLGDGNRGRASMPIVYALIPILV
jgi:hypothetical protein